MRVASDHTGRATRPIPGRARRNILAGLAIAGSVTIVATLYWIVARNGAGFTQGHFHSDLALLTGLTIAACGALALMIRRQRAMQEEIERLETRLEEVSDREWQIKEAEEHAKSFLEAQGDVIVRRDAAGRITYVNDAFCTLAGRGRDALIGAHVALPLLEQGAVAVLPDGTRIHDQKIETADGPRWIAWRDVPVRADKRNRTETQSVGRDVTDRASAGRALAEARDQADAANRAKGRFLAMVSHEIRTPLNGILGMADLLLDTPLTAEQTTYVRAVKSSGDTLMALIGDVLDFSKIEAGRLDLEAKAFRLDLLIEEVVELLAPRAQAKGLEIAAFTDARLAAEVVGDPVRLRQVLLNLAGNAVKFTPAGGVAVLAEPGAGPDDVTFRVRDTGIGIEADAQARIFGEFEQAESGTTRRHGGTGLGLAISQRIVARMGGRIAVDSTPGAGATFAFTVPLAPTQASASTSAPRLDASVVIVATSAEAIEASLVARRLSAWGAAARVIAGADAVPAALADARCDSIMVDGALGFETARDIVRACPAAIARRVVLVTPGERNELGALKDAGFTGYLIKPVRAASLAARFAAEPSGFDAAGDSRAETDRPRPAASATALAVLVAEDNEINALLTRSLLAKLGHRPTVAATGTDAVEAWRAAHAAGAPYDLVLMDLHMPDMDGLEAARRIRAAEHTMGCRRTPIIALTANAFSDDRDACLAAGMDAFLTKPLDRERLTELLATRQTSLAA